MHTQKVNKLLKYVSTNVPYYKPYRNLLLSEYPFINKKMIKEDYELFLSDQLKEKEKVVQELKSPMKIENYIIQKSLPSDLVLEWTTGSSGIPFKCVKSKSERNAMSLNIWKKRMRFNRGITPDRFCPLIHTGEKILPFDIRDYSIQNLENLYNYIESSGYTTIHTTPTLLKRHLLDSKVDQSIFRDKVQFIESTGSYLSDSNKEMYEKIFNAKIFNFYGLIELWTISTTCRYGNMHINSNNIYFELIDEEENLIFEKNKVGQIVVTGLNQFTMPFIRYKTGDFAEYSEMDCPCGDKDPVISLMENRHFHYLKDKENVVIDGNKLVKTLLRYVFWEHEFSEINYLCLFKENNQFVFYLNPIPESNFFEALMSRELTKKIGNQSDIIYKYITLKEYEELNFKNHLFINKSRKTVTI